MWTCLGGISSGQAGAVLLFAYLLGLVADGTGGRGGHEYQTAASDPQSKPSSAALQWVHSCVRGGHSGTFSALLLPSSSISGNALLGYHFPSRSNRTSLEEKLTSPLKSLPLEFLRVKPQSDPKATNGAAPETRARSPAPLYPEVRCSVFLWFEICFSEVSIFTL